MTSTSCSGWRATNGWWRRSRASSTGRWRKAAAPAERVASVAEARARTIPQRVVLQAQLLDRPDLTLARKIHVQDATGAISVYLDRGAYPPLTTGDRLTFDFGYIDRLTRPEKQQFRYQITRGNLAKEHLGKTGPWSVAIQV